MAFSLAKYGEARALVKAELAAKLTGPVTYASMRELPFTFAFLKETMRCDVGPPALSQTLISYQL